MCNKMRRLLHLGLFVGAILAAPAALGWGKGGHMVSAFIASERLTPHARQEAARLLAVPLPLSEGADFVRASYWADEVRARMKEQYGFSASYHFIDFPFSTDGTPLPADLPQPENIVRALTSYVAVLRAPSASDAAKAEALRFVIHFAGDIHQPLHCVSRVSRHLPHGDEGGNRFGIRDRNQLDSRYNLHKYWDNGMERFPRMGPDYAPPPMEEIGPAARHATQAYPDSAADWRAGGAEDFQAWAIEGSAIAQRYAYRGVARGKVPSARYEEQSFAIAEQQVARAGYRLARLLNGIWP
jgi:hypothetical protein